MKEKIEEKLKYYENQVTNNTDRFLFSNLRKDRDILIKNRERVKVYKEILKEL